MSPGDDERRPGEGRQIVQQTEQFQRNRKPTAAELAQLDQEYVRLSFRRSWDPEVKRLRRSLRGAA